MATTTVRWRIWLLAALALALSALMGTTLFAGSGAAPAGQPAAVTIEPVGHFGGWPAALTLSGDGNRLYLGEGNGFTVVDVSDKARPRQLGGVSLHGNDVNSIAIGGDRAYLSNSRALHVVDITDPSRPTALGKVDLPNTRGAAVAGAYAYVGAGNWLRTVDVSNPLSPTVAGGLDLGRWPASIQISGALAYVGAGSALLIVDVSNPVSPTLRGVYIGTATIGKVQVIGATAYLAAGSAGLLIVDVSNPAVPTLRGAYNTAGWAGDVQVVGATAYVADGNAGVAIVNVANPISPTLVATTTLAGAAIQIGADGSYAHVLSQQGVTILDVRNPAAPRLAGVYQRPSVTQAVAVAGSQGYMLETENRLWVLDVNTPAVPHAVSVLTLGGSVARSRVAATGTLAYIAEDNYGIEIVQAANPLSPTVIGRYPRPNAATYIHDVAVQGNYAYVPLASGGGWPGADGRLHIVNVSNPLSPTLAANFDTPGDARRVAVSGTVAYVADGSQGLRLVNVANPAAPVPLGAVPPPTTTATADVVLVRGNRAYVGSNAGASYWLQEINISNPANPTVVHTTQGTGTVNELGADDAYLYASVAGGSLHVFDFGLAHVTGYSSVSYSIIVIRMGNITYIWTIYHSWGSGIVTVGQPGPTPTPTRTPTVTCSCQIQTKQEFVSPAPGNVPAPTTGATCAVDPAGSVPCDCGTGVQTVNAIDRPACCGACGWNFYEWKGSCAGATGRNPTATVACPATGACDAIAVWHRPLLGVSSTPAQGEFCASKQNSDKGAMSFELCASALDDWTVTSLTFQAGGSGKDDQEIEKVKLTFDGKTLEGKYTADDGTVVFAVAVEIKKGQCKSGTLSYTFKQLSCPLCDDPVRKTGCKEDKEFSVTLPAANVTAAAKSYPRSLVIGEATGGPLKLQCIKNTNTSKYFYEIQKAVDDGATQNGHTIQVCPGTYTENVNVTKELTIRSTDGWSLTTVQAAATNDHVFEVARNNTTIQGFTIRGATGANKAGVYLGSAAAAAAPVALSESTTDSTLRRDASEESGAAERDASAHTTGLSMTGPAAGVEDCKVLGNALWGNRYGVFLDGASKVQIGGTTVAERNVISGNSGDGVRISGAGATGNKVLGNRIGADAAGTGNAGNGGSGVWIGDAASRNTIGGTDVIPGAACDKSCNLIAYNAGDGVTVAAGSGNAIQGNSIHSNAKLGIDLGGDGWTRNDKTGGAAPNNWQNYPVITGTLTLASGTLVTGTLTARTNTTYRLEFFTNAACETTGLVQGRELILAMDATTDANGRVRINTALPRPVQILTVTATDPDGNTSEFSPPDIQITAVEVTQAIQNLKNEAPLVKDKLTTVRVYVRAVGCDVPNVTAEIVNGAGDRRNAPNPIKAVMGADPRPSETERAIAGASLNIVLPKSWRQGTDSWRVKVNPGCRSPDAVCDEPNVFGVSNVTFQRTEALDLRLVPIRYTRGGANLTPLKSEYENYLRYFLNLYPISRMWYGIEAPMAFDGDLTTPGGWDDLHAELRFRHRNTGNSDTRIYGVVDDAVPYLDASGNGIQGMARVTKFLGTWWSRFAVGRVDANHGQWIMIHEVGHTLARPHPGCTTNEGPDDPAWPSSYSNCQIAPAGATSYWGFDDSTPKGIKPDTHSDFMTYAFLPSNGGKDTWVSEYTYRKLLEKLTTSATRTATVDSLANGDSLAARGVVNLKTGDATFDFMYRLNEPGIPYEPSPGPYMLELQDVAGRVIVTHTFDLDNPHLPSDLEAAHFMEWLPYDTRTARIVLKRAGTELAARIVSANPPTVTVTYPNGGETLMGAVTVRWTARDADGDPMRYMVEYSSDGGATWKTLATRLDQPSFMVDTAELPGGDRCLFRVLATDGVNTGQDQSNGFCTVSRKPPSAVIGSPANGAWVPEGYPLLLWGLGSDPEDGPLADAALTWTDSISGTLGIGGEIELPEGPSRGWHTITLTATDSDGMTGTASVRVCVGCTSIYLPVILR